MTFRSALTGLLLAGTTFAAGAACASAPTYAVSGKVAASDGGWDYASFDPVLRRVYLTHAGGVTALDVDTGKVTAKLAETPGPHQVVPLPGGRVLLVTVAGTSTARFIDAQTGATLGEVPTGKGPDAAIYDPASGLVIVADHAGGDVVLIDPATMTSVGSIAVGGALEYLAVDGAGGVFLAVEDKNELVSLDVKAKTVARRLPLAGCDGPAGLAYATAARALIASCGGGKAAVIDAANLRLTGLLDIGTGPDAVLYDPIRQVAFIPCGRSGELYVISAGAPGKVAVVGKVATEKSARTGAVDPKTGNVYLPAARYGAPPAAGQRPAMEPGSFHFIVVSPAA